MCRLIHVFLLLLSIPVLCFAQESEPCSDIEYKKTIELLSKKAEIVGKNAIGTSLSNCDKATIIRAINDIDDNFLQPYHARQEITNDLREVCARIKKTCPYASTKSLEPVTLITYKKTSPECKNEEDKSPMELFNLSSKDCDDFYTTNNIPTCSNHEIQNTQEYLKYILRKINVEINNNKNVGKDKNKCDRTALNNLYRSVDEIYNNQQELQNICGKIVNYCSTNNKRIYKMKTIVESELSEGECKNIPPFNLVIEPHECLEFFEKPAPEYEKIKVVKGSYIDHTREFTGDMFLENSFCRARALSILSPQGDVKKVAYYRGTGRKVEKLDNEYYISCTKNHGYLVFPKENYKDVFIELQIEISNQFQDSSDIFKRIIRAREDNAIIADDGVLIYFNNHLLWN